ncbi:bifunctional diguanylate cyclase/phosphodiesterase [Thiomicrospira microaerophila]|uniref:bifunctional diguanylate cyclase/phosphodiesterase n=1 Tax=Thiomicrospira microaerophila TaxID=406020 RepID=UPI00200F447E|nr:bifunctional diguanylate cyclase/phosphodiesterase [Thiomicrospira microaerophila]UQB42119.1 bifunctional diguanylate cyclase/phosphodiesterase [Thiomicrospira microaerophila]
MFPRLKPIQAKWHMLMFLSASLGAYLFMFGYLYSSAQNIKAQTEQQMVQFAEQELKREIQSFIDLSAEQIERLKAWDEVHQQLSQPRYYFFWRDERLKVSQHWRPYFNELEIYNSKGQQLFHKGPNDPVSPFLPNEVPSVLASFSLDQEQLSYRVFTDVQQRQTGDKLGYLGLNLNLMVWLQQDTQFKYIERASLTTRPGLEADKISIQDLVFQPAEYLDFKLLENPVDHFLWTLIQDFISYVLLYAVLVAVLFVLFFRYSLVRPLASLSAYLTELKTKPDQVVRPKAKFMVSEFEALKSSLASYNRALVDAQQKIDVQRQLAYQQSRTDALSGLPNRHAFDEAMQSLEQQFSSEGGCVGFMLVDCDYFKAINDTYGHCVGDQVIKLTARALTECLPLSTQVFRIGGDEFAAVLPGINAAQLREMASHCLAHLKQMPFAELGIHERVHFSVGLSLTAQAISLTKLHKHADIALYKAKHSLHDKIQLFADEDSSAGKTLVSNERISIIMNALRSGEGIEMHLQPIVSVDQNVIYYEALVRIRKQGVLIFPGEIFDVVNHRHLEIDLDLQVIAAIIQLFKEGKIAENTGISLNISPQSLLQLDLQDALKQLVAYAQTYRIIIEVTETTLITNMVLVTAKLKALRELGFKIALDDFGSGYSSIRYLANMPVDIIKFDMTLTQALELDEKTCGIIQSTAAMIRQADYKLVMEGVETLSQFEAAKLAGATGFQGYYFGKPQPA